MTISSLGSVSIGATIPGPVTAISITLPDLQAKINALLAFAPSITPPSFSADLAVAADITAGINAAISLGLTPPSISLQLSIIADILLTLQGQLSIVLGIVNLFAEAGIDLYSYDGPQNALGGELTTALGSDSTHANALIMVTKLGATWSAMGGVFKVA